MRFLSVSHRIYLINHSQTGNILNTQNYTLLLADPQQITKQALPDLVEVIDAYPYFQSARALWLKGLKNQESFRYNDALKLTAAHTTNRDILFEFITSESFEQDQISLQILSNDQSIGQYDIEIGEMNMDFNKNDNAYVDLLVPVTFDINKNTFENSIKAFSYNSSLLSVFKKFSLISFSSTKFSISST